MIQEKLATKQQDLFREVYQQYFPRIYAYFRLCFGEDEADDLSQQLFLRVWKAMGKVGFSEPNNWKAWLFQIAVNVKNDKLRFRYTQPQFVELQEDSRIAEGQEAGTVQSLAIEEAFSRMKKEEKMLLLLKAEGLTSDEIGEILKASASTVRSRLVKAREHLKQELQKGGIEGYA